MAYKEKATASMAPHHDKENAIDSHGPYGQADESAIQNWENEGGALASLSEMP